jgi:hypothetical protein
MSQQLRVLREFGLQLQMLEPAQPAVAARAAVRRRVALVVVVLLVLALATGALAAAGVFSTGAPVKPAAKDLITPRSGSGAAIAGSVGPIVATAADPAGGPAWGTRAVKTTRGLGCVQVGRLVDGRLGVLGEDGAFADDGRFHALPPQVNQAPVDCGALDARGQLFLAFESQGFPASGDPTGCTRPGDVEPHPKPAICPQADERAIYAGLLGPAAVSLTYTDVGGSARTIHTGPDGAYLIVTQADPQILGGANFAGLLPTPGNGDPITSINYRGGEQCVIGPGTVTTRAGRPCDPVGYVAAKFVTPSRQLLAVPVDHVLRIDALVHGHRADELLVSFTAKAAVQGATSAYTLHVQLPESGTCHGDSVGTVSDSDITVGQTAHLNLVYAHPAGLLACAGTYAATVYYEQGATAGVPIAGPPGANAAVVGRFSFRVK